MSCSNNNELLNGASSSVLPTSSIVSLPLTTSSSSSSPSDNNNNNNKTNNSQIQQKSAIVQAGNQLIITTTASSGVQKLTSQSIPTQKVVSVIPAVSGASSSTIGSSSGGGNNNNNNNSSTGSDSYPIQHYQTFSSEGPIYQNTFYNNNNNINSQNNGQTPSNFPSTTTLAPSESQATAVYYMYPESSLELENGFELDGHVSHTAQAAPVTVQWLVDNFEPAEGCSLRRSSLYNFYMHHCEEQKIEPVNPASFGKLIRSVFLGLRTRRLGTRGNSKYHYYGIRVKANSPLNSIPEDHAIPSRIHASTTINPSKRLKTTMFDHEYKNTTISQDLSHHNTTTTQSSSSSSSWTPIANNNSNGHQQTTILTNSTNVLNEGIQVHTPINGGGGGILSSVINNTPSSSAAAAAPPAPPHSSTITQTPPTVTIVQSSPSITQTNAQIEAETKTQEFIKIINSLPHLGNINVISLPDNCDVEDVKKFEDLYKNHCQRILDLVIGLKLSCIDEVWQKFWRCPNVDYSEYENLLPKDRFVALCSIPPVIEFVKACDYQFYQFCVDTLIPDVLRAIPGNFSQQIRNFAKSLENWLRNALLNIPEEMQQIKLKIINAFAMTLRRYTTLNHLAQAAKALLQNTQQINQMLTDLNRVDFRTVQQQASWICQCDDESINNFEKEFKKNLQNKSSVEDWAKWLDAVVTSCLEKYEGTDKYAKMAHQFLLKWSFYCSTIIRDLTLRSAPSFGGFHLIRLLYDEYMFYLIEHKIAKSVNETAIAVMSDLSLLHGQNIDD